MSSKISINLVVFNGEKYIRHCLDSVKNLNYPHELIEVNIWDNNSTDKTKKIIKELAAEGGSAFGGGIDEMAFANFRVIENPQNIGMWAGQERLLEVSTGKYVVVLSVDVILDRNFLLEAMQVMESNASIGALQAKIYQFNLVQLKNGNWKLDNDVIDTCGFKIFRSRRVVNIGHGEKDAGQYDTPKEIFGVEGAVPIFRKEAFTSLKIKANPSDAGEIFDHDFFWYAEDLDIAWRMNLFGWKQVYAPRVLAWHDRQTTKSLSGGFSQFRESRQQIPLNKRRLEWRNIRFTMIKNEYIINCLKDFFYMAKRELAMLAYLLIYEPAVLVEVGTVLKNIPKMLKKRSAIMRRAVVTPIEIHRWYE